ncbi:MAG: PepSY domain-containing protein [Proteobacteria bacterium]|nr:PepSY domain-containing protein [Pseudomonadota bacterium]
MKPTNRKLRRTLLALAAGAGAALAAAPALSGDDCDVPVERWRSRDAVMQMAAGKGWQVQRLKIDDGCYEIRGRDAQGREFKAKLDPQTLQVVRMKGRERDRDRDRSRARDDRGPARNAQPAGAASAAGPLFTPGTAPRAQID